MISVTKAIKFSKEDGLTPWHVNEWRFNYAPVFQEGLSILNKVDNCNADRICIFKHVKILTCGDLYADT